MKKVLFLLVVFSQATFADSVHKIDATQINNANASFAIEVNFSILSADSQEGTTGLGLRLHYSSSDLGTPELLDTYQEGLIGVSIEDDGEDLDGFPDTDKFILMAWASMSGGWAAQNPILLARIEGTHPLAKQSTMRFTAADTPPGVQFEAVPLELAP